MEYFIRLTPYKATTFEDIIDVFSAIDIDTYVISYEEASRNHYHAYIISSYSPERLRYQLKSKLSSQVYISGTQVLDKVKTIAYTIKDGNYKHKNIDVNTLLMAESVSKPKFNFDDELKKILDKDITPDKLVDEIIDLYVQSKRKIYIQHIQAIVRNWKAQKDSSYRKELKNKILDNL